MSEYIPTSKLTPAEHKIRREKEKLKKQIDRADDDDTAFKKALKVLEKTAEKNPALEKTMLAGMAEMYSRWLEFSDLDDDMAIADVVRFMQETVKAYPNLEKILLVGMKEMVKQWQPIPAVKAPFPYMGSKAQFREEIDQRLCETIRNVPDTFAYCEPFCGSLAAFLAVADSLKSRGIKRVILNDFNPHLINFYKMVQYHHLLLIEEIIGLEHEFSILIPAGFRDKEIVKAERPNHPELKAHFQTIRSMVEKTEGKALKRAAQFWFLQWHAFNGVYCENNDGSNGMAFNWKCKTKHKKDIHELIGKLFSVFQYFDIEFTNKHFRELEWLQDTFFYLDPPYIDSTKNYKAGGFSMDEQRELAKVVQESGAPFMYSNNYHSDIVSLFNCHIEKIERSNRISASGKSRGVKKPELLAYRMSAWPFRVGADRANPFLNFALKDMAKD